MISKKNHEFEKKNGLQKFKIKKRERKPNKKKLVRSFPKPGS